MSNWFQRARRAITVMTLPMLLAACGGGTEQITPFEPQRYFVFGDEMSALATSAAVRGSVEEYFTATTLESGN